MKKILSLFILTTMVVCFIACRKNDSKTQAVDKGPVPDSVWQEHWLEHDQKLTLVYYDQEVAVYKDAAVPPGITWPYELMSRTWKYAKAVYGEMGKDPRLYVVLHGGTYGNVGQPQYYPDSSGDNRNIVDFSCTDWNDFVFPEPGLIHEVCHVIESCNNNVKGSPAFEVWGDSKWQDIFIYDVYKGLQMEDKLKAFYNFYLEDAVNYPAKNSHWFKNWWLPIYTKYGESKVLNNFFVLLSKNFPKANTAENGFPEYTRRMNLGEYIHFMSGAAGVNLQAIATEAFGWSEECDAQFKKARIDFPDVKYAD
jgi:hypothetical protein